MEVLLPYIKQYEVWIYLVFGVVALYYLQKLIVAWKDWQGTVYGLEREVAQRRFTTALTVILLSMAFILVEFVIVSFVAPMVPQSVAVATPTLDVLATPTVTLAFQGAGLSGLESTPVETPTPTTPPLQEGCTPGQIEWLYPQAGEEISQTVELKGTVNVPNLGFYKYQYSRPGEETWTDIAAGNQPKVEGQIGFWNTSQLPGSGDYLLRLIVYDNANESFPACVVPVRVLLAP